MSSRFSRFLTGQLRAFVEASSREEAPFATLGEFMRHMSRERTERHEARRIREAILEGYQDAIEGRTVTYRGDLRRLMRSRTA